MPEWTKIFMRPLPNLCTSDWRNAVVKLSNTVNGGGGGEEAYSKTDLVDKRLIPAKLETK